MLLPLKKKQQNNVVLLPKHRPETAGIPTEEEAGEEGEGGRGGEALCYGAEGLICSLWNVIDNIMEPEFS